MYRRVSMLFSLVQPLSVEKRIFEDGEEGEISLLIALQWIE